MEEDILKGFDFEINNIINHCLNGREITATEYVFIKQTLLLKIEDLIKKNERLINKYKEQEKVIDFMIEWIRARSIYAVDSHEKLKDYFKKKAREK